MHHKVALYDPDVTYLDLATWAKNNCKSYEKSQSTDLSDISYRFDVVYEFWFENEKDATMFYMRWT